MTRDERITKLRKGCWIRYPRAEQILAQLDDLLKHPKTHRMPNLLVFGQTNNGKTALIQRFIQLHLPKLGDDRTLSRIPVVVIQAPPAPGNGDSTRPSSARCLPRFDHRRVSRIYNTRRSACS